MYYVYILRSISSPNIQYVGFSTNLKKRIDAHNSGYSMHTKRFRPWHLETYVGFNDVKKARKFEYYLKTGSGKAFLKRHL